MLNVYHKIEKEKEKRYRTYESKTTKKKEYKKKSIRSNETSYRETFKH